MRYLIIRPSSLGGGGGYHVGWRVTNVTGLVGERTFWWGRAKDVVRLADTIRDVRRLDPDFDLSPEVVALLDGKDHFPR